MDELRAYMGSEGTSQAELAALLDISESMLSLILAGKRKPGFALTRRIEALTGIHRAILRPDVYEAAQ